MPYGAVIEGADAGFCGVHDLGTRVVFSKTRLNHFRRVYSSSGVLVSPCAFYTPVSRDQSGPISVLLRRASFFFFFIDPRAFWLARYNIIITRRYCIERRIGLFRTEEIHCSSIYIFFLFCVNTKRVFHIYIYILLYKYTRAAARYIKIR